MKKIAIIDCESNGSSTSTSRIISISGILVNSDLVELDRFEFYCSNVPGYVPDPYSLWVNKGLKKLKETNMSHFNMMIELRKYIEKWSPCVWGSWNGISFDFPLIQKENYKTLLPIYATNTNGNEHADFLPVARASKIFFPNALETNYSEKKNPIFKLDDLGPKNFPDLDKSKHHTATHDVEVTLKVIEKLKNKAKPIYDASLLTTGKESAKKIILEKQIFTTVFYFFGKARSFATTYFFDHAIYKWPMVFCLENDPKDLMALDYNSLKETMRRPGKFIRALPLKHPVVLDVSYALNLEPYKTIGKDKLVERSQMIKDNPEFAENCSRAIAEIAEERAEQKKTKQSISADLDPHNQLYSGGFPSEKDQEIMKKFHKSKDWEERYKIVLSFSDERFKHFGLLLIYQNQPNALPQDVYKKIHLETALRILSVEQENFTTIPMAEHLIDTIRAEKDISKEKLEYMNEIDSMIKEMRVIYEKALKSASKIDDLFEKSKEIKKDVKKEIA
tara:strand:+ start:614 stop:2128 length:1515 start_codon:yes stop_codon:yes gene_type:complete